MSSESPEYSPFFAVMGASAAMVFSGNYDNSITIFTIAIFKSFVNSNRISLMPETSTETVSVTANELANQLHGKLTQFTSCIAS